MSFSKKSLVAAVLAVAALGVAQAQAGVIYTVSRTSVNGYDDLTFRLTGWTGADLAYSSGTNGVSTLEGTWTVAGSGSPTMSVPGTTANWKAKTSNASSPLVSGLPYTNPPASYVNFDSIVGTSSFFVRASATPTTFGGTWYTSGDASSTASGTRLVPNGTENPNSGIDQGLIAEIFVTPGADVTFSGAYNSYANVAVPLTLTSVAVPEPASMALMGIGALALLRRRKTR